jgi:hypothetical protein
VSVLKGHRISRRLPFVITAKAVIKFSLYFLDSGSR